MTGMKRNIKGSQRITMHGPRKPHRKTNSGPWRAPTIRRAASKKQP